MKCVNCDGTCIKRPGELAIDDQYVGSFTLDAVDFYECDTCKNRFYPLKTARLIDKKRDKIKERILRSMPLDEFFSAKETAEYLKITRQALHKNRKIKRGFIYKTTFGESAVYLKKSVHLYKSTGDGRFPLVEGGPVHAHHEYLNFGSQGWWTQLWNECRPVFTEPNLLIVDRIWGPHHKSPAVARLRTWVNPITKISSSLGEKNKSVSKYH
jgi:hypothetical protein